MYSSRLFSIIPKKSTGKHLPLLTIFLFSLLFFATCSKGVTINSAQNPQTEISCVFSDPDGGEPFWRFLNHDDKHWHHASDFNELNKMIRLSKNKEVWIRLVVNHSAETLNNSYFRIANTGEGIIYINGIEWVKLNPGGSDTTDVIISPRRPENLGKNVYAIHILKSDSVAPFFLGFIQPGWMETDTETVPPNHVVDTMMRDGMVCKGGDGYWYLTGTTGDSSFLQPGEKNWLISEGIQLFRSKDLTNWDTIGYVWTFDKNATWQKDFGTIGGRGPARGVFAPQLHYIKGKYWLIFSVNHTTASHQFGITLLCSDKAEGPYIDVSPQRQLTNGFDPDLFEDDDGKVYFLKHGGEIAEMKEDMSGIASPFRQLRAANYPYVGYEGVFLFKRDKKYYLTSAEWNVHPDGKNSYDSMIASADSIYGPYSNRYCALRFGGHNGYFEGPGGYLYATLWCYPDKSPEWQMLTITRMVQNNQDLWHPAK